MVRTQPRSSPASLVSASAVRAVCFASLLCAGCSGDDPIEQYTVPREQFAPEREPTRMLTALFKRPDATWFLKLEGPAGAVGAANDAFEKFVRSVRFPAGQPIDWTLPDGWKREAGNENRFATLQFATAAGQPLTVAVTKFGPDAGSLLANVNRWRGMIGLSETTEARAQDAVRDFKTEQGEAFQVVDLTGPGKAQSGPPRQAPPTEVHGGPIYDLPTGWSEVKPPKTPFAVREFVAGEGTAAPVVTFSIVGGDLATNLNRWRMQVGLKEMSREDLVNEVHESEIAGRPAALVDFAGTAKRVVGVAQPLDDRFLFIKMTGPTEGVGAQRAAFEAFIKSIRFGGEEQGKP